MSFIDLRKELKNVCFKELRQDRNDYLEAVVVKNELGKFTASLEKFLGPAVSPSQLPQQIAEILAEFGGIMSGQALYFKDEGSDKIIAMLWPWQDGIHTTVKIINKG
jgi:hypothetical protein